MYLDITALARPSLVAAQPEHTYNANIVLGIGWTANLFVYHVKGVYVGCPSDRHIASVTFSAVHLRRMSGLGAAVDQAFRVTLPYLVSVAGALGERLETSRISRVLSSVPDRLAVHLVIRALEACARRPSEIWSDT